MSKTNKKGLRLTTLFVEIIVLLALLAGIYWISQNSTQHPSETESTDYTDKQESETESDTASEIETETDTESDIETESDTQELGTQEETDIVEEIDDFTMFFAGDVLLRENTLTGYNKSGIDGLLSEYLQQEMINADLNMFNQEFPFSTRGTPMENKKYTFRTDPSYVKVFQEMGADVVSLANNHALDYGQDALVDTFTTLDNAGIPYVGAGETKKRAEEAIYIEANGRKIGVLSASRVIPVVEWNIENCQPGLFCTYSSKRLEQRIREVEEECDFVVVYVHWGVERVEYPKEYQHELAKKYIDAGADLVIGSHSHVPQGIEYYKGVPIIYCLGNFIFTPKTVDTYALKVVFTKTGETTLQVIPVAARNACTKELTGDSATSFIEYLESISFNAKIDQNGMVTENLKKE